MDPDPEAAGREGDVGRRREDRLDERATLVFRPPAVGPDLSDEFALGLEGEHLEEIGEELAFGRQLDDRPLNDLADGQPLGHGRALLLQRPQAIGRHPEFARDVRLGDLEAAHRRTLLLRIDQGAKTVLRRDLEEGFARLADPLVQELRFTDPLDRTAVEDPESWSLRQWNYRWTATYGSKNHKVSNPDQQGEDGVEVQKVTLRGDRTVVLAIKDLRPVMQMEIAYSLKAADGSPVKDRLWLTINAP
jgi:hypothetical protein